jgi:hypothetical protein
MLVKMRRDATRDEVTAVEDKLHGLGFKTATSRSSRWGRSRSSPASSS